jgi:phage terminase large subunit GpA-like protein
MFQGQRQIKLCPYDLKSVDVTYCIKENIYNYGYIMQPDDTFIFDPATSQDTQWDDAAFSKLFTAMLALYSAWSRDNTLTDWSRILHNEGIL